MSEVFTLVFNWTFGGMLAVLAALLSVGLVCFLIGGTTIIITREVTKRDRIKRRLAAIAKGTAKKTEVVPLKRTGGDK